MYFKLSKATPARPDTAERDSSASHCRKSDTSSLPRAYQTPKNALINTLCRLNMLYTPYYYITDIIFPFSFVRRFFLFFLFRFTDFEVFFFFPFLFSSKFFPFFPFSSIFFFFPFSFYFLQSFFPFPPSIFFFFSFSYTFFLFRLFPLRSYAIIYKSILNAYICAGLYLCTLYLCRILLSYFYISL